MTHQIGSITTKWVGVWVLLAFIASQALATTQGDSIQVARVNIELPAVAWVDRPSTRLGEVANISTHDLDLLKQLLGVQIQSFSGDEVTVKLTTVDLENLMIQSVPLKRSDIAWTGANGVTLRRASGRVIGQVTASETVRVIHDELMARGAIARVTLRSAPADWTPPPGAITLHVRDLGQQLTTSGEQVVWVDAHADGQFTRRLPIGISIEGMVGMTPPARPVPAEQPHRIAVVERRQEAWRQRPNESHLDHREVNARTADTAGPQRSAEVGTAVARGAFVRLLVRREGVEIETQAESLQNGGVGDVVRVRPRKGGETLLSRVVAKGTVEVMHVE